MLKTIGTREKVLADKLLNRFCKEDKVDGDKRKRRSKKAENIPLDARMSTPLLKLKKLKLVKSNPPAKQEIKRQSRQIAKEWKKLEVKRKPAERRLKLRKANKSESMQNVVRNGRNNPHRINAATPPMKHSCQLFYDSDEDRRQLSCLNRRKNRVGRPIPAYAGCRMPSPKLGRNVYSFTSASPSDSDWFELQSEKGENHWWNRNSAFKRLTFGRVMTEQLTVDSIDMPELPVCFFFVRKFYLV